MSLTQSIVRHRRAVAVASGIVALLAVAGPASAKETAGTVTFSSPPATTNTGCSPIQSEKITSSTKTGDTGGASITVDYQVKPCDSKQVVTLETLVADYFDATAVVYDNAPAPLSGKFTFGAVIAKNYRVTLIVRDAGTGATVWSEDRLANVPRPTGV